MPFLRFYNFRLKYLLAGVVALFLVGCSSEDGGSGVSSLSWVAPSVREDNTALSLSEIAGYRIYYGVESGNYKNIIDIGDGSATQAQISGVPSGIYYAVMTTIDADGRESLISEEVIVYL